MALQCIHRCGFVADTDLADKVFGLKQYVQHVNFCTFRSPVFDTVHASAPLFTVRLHCDVDMTAICDGAPGDDSFPTPPDHYADLTPSTRAIIIRGGPAYTLSSSDLHLIAEFPDLKLYLGSEAAARCESTLRQFGVAGVVNCAYNSTPLPQEQLQAAGVTFYQRLNLADVPSGQPNESMLLAGAEAVRSALDRTDSGPTRTQQQTTVLVHCVAGVSRSASVVIAYLVKYRGFSLLDAATRVKAARPVAYPNYGFFLALLDIEKAVRGECSVPREVVERYHWKERMPMDTYRLSTYSEEGCDTPVCAVPVDARTEAHGREAEAQSGNTDTRE